MRVEDGAGVAINELDGLAATGHVPIETVQRHAMFRAVGDD